MREVIATTKAPAAIGPYSQGIRVTPSNMMFLSGQLGLDPKSGNLVSEKVAEQATQAMKNLNAVLEAGGFNKAHIVKTTIFLKDMGDFAAVNEVYAAFFEHSPPARSTVEVARLPKDAKVEIEAMAAR